MKLEEILDKMNKQMKVKIFSTNLALINNSKISLAVSPVLEEIFLIISNENKNRQTLKL